VRRAAIVCGVDHSEGSRRALPVAADLAGRLDSRLLLINVRPSPAEVPPGTASESDVVRERAVAGGRRLLEQLGAEFLEESGARRLLDLVVGRVEFGDPAYRLARVADEVRATLIVVGARGRGPSGSLVLGRVSQTPRRRGLDPSS
jgi:nucleotide-binding universal stress UspA family protein